MGFSARVGLVVLVMGAVCLSCRPEATAPDRDTRLPAASLLAVGDTGSPRGLLPFVFDGQFAVGAAMQRAHEASPVDAVVLLGDNFYPDGLRADELVPRILANVARPYCAFVEPSTALAKLLGEGCSPAREAVPRLLVALGNHDLQTPASAELQQNEVPRFVLNWEVPTTRVPAVRELPGGLSLVFLDTEWPWGPEEVDALASALEAARGPWRVIVGHRPPIAGHPQLSKMIERAAQRSGRVIHAYLAGHVHGLAAIRGVGTAPSLTLIAGSGSGVDLQSAPEYRIEAAGSGDVVAAKLGFVRLDVFDESGQAGDPARLRVSLFAARSSAALAWLGASEIARYAIGLDGSVERTETLQDRSSAGGQRRQVSLEPANGLGALPLRYGRS